MGVGLGLEVLGGGGGGGQVPAGGQNGDVRTCSLSACRHFQPSAFYMIVKLRLLPVRRGSAGRHEPVWDGEVGQRLQLGRMEGGRGLVRLAG